MPAHTNFFETLKEAHIRLRGAVVMYDKNPYTVIAITDHKKDGIFRVYLDPIGRDPNVQYPHPQGPNEFPAESNELGESLDRFLEAHPTAGYLRKQMNSPLFDKFRPFPLGMVNVGKNCIYTEWQPTRSTYQGMTRANITEHHVTLGPQVAKRSAGGGAVIIGTTSPEFRDCLVGEYPSAKECVEKLTSGEFDNTAVGFDRNFALVRGPVDTLYLGYKTEIIGWLPEGDLSSVLLGRKYQHTREVIDALGIFSRIK